MDDITDFYSVGKNFTKPRNYDPIEELKNDLDEKLKELSPVNNGLSSDGRPRDEFSIVFNPDPDYINPDTTGNGVCCMEGLDLNYYGKDVEQNAVLAKSELNNFANILLQIKSNLINVTKTIDLSPNKVMALRIIYDNMCASKTTVKLNYDFSKFKSDEFKAYFINYFDTINKIDFSWKPTSKSKGYASIIDELFLNKDIRNFDDNLYYFDVRKSNKEVYLREAAANFENYMNTIRALNMCLDKIEGVDFNRNLTKLVTEFKKVMKTMNSFEASIAKNFVDTIYNYGVNLSKDIINISKYVMSVYSLISPVSLAPEVNPKSLLRDIEKKNPWVSADYHLLKDLVKGSNDLSETEKIIQTHNKYVKPNDLFLFLGDISESEIYDQNNRKYLGKLIECCKRLNGIKIIIIGNNDCATKQFYKECGFVEIYENPILTKKYVFSHGPIIADDGFINVHGHIHGSKNYWGVDHENHVDAYIGLYGQPIKLNDLVSPKNMVKYQQGCVTKSGPKYDNRDPETKKIPTII